MKGFFFSGSVVNLLLNHTGNCFCSSFVSLSFSFTSNPHQQTCRLLVIVNRCIWPANLTAAMLSLSTSWANRDDDRRDWHSFPFEVWTMTRLSHQLLMCGNNLLVMWVISARHHWHGAIPPWSDEQRPNFPFHIQDSLLSHGNVGQWYNYIVPLYYSYTLGVNVVSWGASLNT